MGIGLTKKDALKIRAFRKNGSWRWVAARVSEEMPHIACCSGNQLDGIDLCTVAAEILGEDPNKEPWN